MMYKYISPNKHQYNVRMVDELNKVIREKEEELKEAKNFIETFRLKLKLRKLYKKLTVHGTEVMEYELYKEEHELK